MGNNSSREYLEEPGNLKQLNLSKKLIPEDYIKHIKGEYIEGCLQTVPLDIIYYDTISLYEKINLSFNYISYIPEEFSLRVPHLRILNISHNQLTGLPNSFQLLLHLRILDLSYNRIEEFPESIVKLLKLNTLNLSHNDLKDLPPSLVNLKALEKLNVSHNALRALPESIVDCLNIQVIVTLSNSLIHPPQAVCDQGTFYILEHLKKSKINSNIKLPQQVGEICSNVFTRIRGEKVMASVNNPESACREYKQAQGRTNRRKCPLMLPESATLSSPDKLKDTIVGLVYGACIGDALGLNTEGLSRDECLFYYCSDDLNLNDRILDLLRSHYPPNDWSSNVDLMLLTMDSLMRWGGVVDELELVSQIMQWQVHGHIDIDPFPGYPLSNLMKQVIDVEGYPGHPHSAAETLYKKILSEQTKGLNFETNPNDNSCLPASLILGVPNFYKDIEVAMNAERICKASHASPLASCCCIFVALLTSTLLQGKFSDQKEENFTIILEEVKEKTLSFFSDEKLREEFDKIFKLEQKLHCDSNDVKMTVRYILTSLRKIEEGFEAILSKLLMYGEKGIAAHGCVVGGVLGALLGYSGLPQHWLQELPKENLAWLNLKINQLLDLFGLP